MDSGAFFYYFHNPIRQAIAMNDPRVVALIYTVEHGNSVSYEKASPLIYEDSQEFRLTVDNKVARFEFWKYFADKDEARKAIEPFIQDWEFEVGVRSGPNHFSLRYKKAEIIDRNPTPPSGRINLRAEPHILSSIVASAEISQVVPQYPSPPLGSAVDLEDSAVVRMRRRFDQYRLGRAKLPDVAYFCVTALEEKYGDRVAAAKKCRVSMNVIKKIATLASIKGGEDARKAEGSDDDFTTQEKQFLKKAIAEFIFRAAQVAADDTQPLPKITMSNLPKL